MTTRVAIFPALSDRIGSTEESRMLKKEDAYQSWFWGEVLLFGLLGALLALFVTYQDLRPSFDLPQVRLVLNTMVALAAVLVAVLGGRPEARLAALRGLLAGGGLDVLLRDRTHARKRAAAQA